MAVLFKPDTAVLYDVSDDGAGGDAVTPYDGTSVTIRGMGYNVSPEDVMRQWGHDVTAQAAFMCDIHATALDTPLGGSFPVIKGQRLTWNSREWVVAGPPVEFRQGLAGDHLLFPLDRGQHD